MNIEKIVIREVECYLNLGKGSVKNTDSFVNDIGCDSLDCIEVVMLMEGIFDVEIDESKCDSDLFTVNDAVALIKECKAT